ncbi:MAG: MFS transporter [Gemmatimonas sp.]|nr:MFS transporter [Gemmatimonas sp.]
MLTTAEVEVSGKQSAVGEAQTRRRWKLRVLFGLMLAYLFYYTGRQNFGWAMSSMSESLGYSMQQLGWISSAVLVTYGLGQFINGNLGDKFGGRVMVTVGGLLSVVLNWVVSFGTSFWTIFAPWAANGYAQSMAWAPGSRMLSNWWPEKERGTAYGLYVFAAGSSSVVIYAIGAGLASMRISWEWVFRLPVLLLGVACIVFWFVARDKPEDVGLSPIEDDHHDALPGGAEESSLQRYGQVFKDWRFLLAVLSIGFESFARYGLVIWVPVHLMGPAYEDLPMAVWIGVALPVGMALGALSAGYVSDRFFGSNRSRPIALFMALAVVVLLLIYVAPVEWLGVGIVLLFLAGFLVYGPHSCYWALCPGLLGRYRAATATGVMNFWAYLVAAGTGPLIGWAIDSFGTTVLFLILSVSCALGALVILPVRR